MNIPLNHLHPIIVHFPVALILVAFFFDLLSYVVRKECPLKCGCSLNCAALLVQILGTLGAIAAITSGFLFTKAAEMQGPAALVKDTHVSFAIITTIIVTVATLLRIILQLKFDYQTKLRYIVTLLLAVAALFVALTGMNGGKIVYDIWLFGN